MTDSIARYRIVISLAVATIFTIVSLAIGFGLGLSIASGLIGAASGFALFRRSVDEPDSSGHAFLKPSLQTGETRTSPRTDLWLLSLEKPSSRLATAWKVFSTLLPLSPLQRVACGAFLVQAAIGAVAIPLFWIAQAAGMNVQLFDASSLGGLFADAFPIAAEATAARARFDSLFLPLVSLNAITLSLSLLAFLGALGPILRNVKVEWRGLFVPLFVYGFWLAFTYGGPSSGWQKSVVAGHAWGYVACLVGIPFFLAILVGSLPNERTRR